MRMKIEELKSEIRKLAKDRNAIILAHNYQLPEVQDVADMCGDSLELSIRASRTDAEVIVFCGVRFMAESAAILSPDKKVIMPRLDAGCPLADSVTAGDIIRLREEHPDAIIVTYVNSPAPVKAESDICCTSANAVSVVRSLDSSRPVVFVPDKNLGAYVEKATGRRKMIIWHGFCPCHDLLNVEDVRRVMREHPQAAFMAHPECRPEVLELAHCICGTAGMLKYAPTSGKETIIVGTEKGMIYPLKKANPKIDFIPASEELICRDMKLTGLENVYTTLLEMKNIVTVPRDVADRARNALERMIGVPAT